MSASLGPLRHHLPTLTLRGLVESSTRSPSDCALACCAARSIARRLDDCGQADLAAEWRATAEACASAASA